MFATIAGNDPDAAMEDISEQYIKDSKGKPCSNESANGIDYLFIYEADGWISIIESDGGIHRLLIQAKDYEHAMSYIMRREPAPYRTWKLVD